MFHPMYKELGFEIDIAQEDMQKTHYLLIKSIRKLISKNTKIKINDEKLYLEDNFKQKYLNESSTVLLKEDSSKNNKEQIDEEEVNKREN